MRTAGAVATEECGEKLAPLLVPGDVLILSGDLGAGKTCLTKGVARALGVVEPVTSPTFNIMRIHEGRIPLHHFDIYRLDSAEQLEDIDYWGTLEADGVSLVEWGDRFPSAVPEECVIVRFTITGDETREIELEPRGKRGAALVRAWVDACSDAAGVNVSAGEGL
ncbi:MAG: tRNA (adenosine(37)-N6)-threonylcarbamoyltransferase complex ATPase subunit type 1 TsaE [Coriobacteriia bacterium]|nr:tRNA (adenosine(37)-N6)-threonylcarbamoyltransferase complex ATPase subunit type 1 TsaE [Coriobacteriia bacterium]